MTLYGLIGRSLGHSFSARFFAEKFAREGISARYINFAIPSIDKLHEIIECHPNLAGFNVTIPYKRDIIPLLDSITPQAQNIGAVNTVCIERDTCGRIKLHGANTDAPGFSLSLQNMLPQHSCNGYQALILGTGGASAAVEAALTDLGILSTYVSRTPENHHGAPCIGYDDITAEIMRSHLVIVNTTPLGTYPDTGSAPPIPYQLLSPRHICHDLVYNPASTRFMQECALRGSAVKNGLDMLHNQALLSYRLWSKS